MKIFKVVRQDCNIGWKETDYVGREEVDIVESESIADLLIALEYYDENYDDDGVPSETARMEKAIKDNGGFMCSHEDYRYWEDPEPCDSYLTYGTYVSFTELTQAELDKMNSDKKKKSDKKKAENNSKWSNLFTDISDVEELKKLLKDYNFPNKIKSE